MKIRTVSLFAASALLMLLVAVSMSAQQKAETEGAASRTEVEALKHRIEELESQNQTILKQNQEMFKALSELKAAVDHAPQATKAVSVTPANDGVVPATPTPVYHTAVMVQPGSKESGIALPNQPPATAKPNAASSVPSAASHGSQGEEAPLTLRIGTASVTPVGFLDFTTVFRSTNTGNGLQTSFGSIPFQNMPAGRLTETRLSAQNSRIGVRVDADVRDAHVTGYLESDFLGVTPGNLVATANSNGMRMRQYWVDIRKGKLEILGGQAWSMLTPNRRSISPELRDLYYGERNLDPNEQLGLVWARDPQLRLVYHASDTVTLGVSFENPDQYIGGSGGGGTITLPAAFSASYATQLDNSTNSLAVPNVHPDIIAKAAFDPHFGGKLFHIEFAGVERTFRVFNPVSQTTATAAGAGGSANFNFELFRDFHLIFNNFYSDGGGRYIFAQAPDLIVRGDGRLSLIHSGSNITGFEAALGKNTVLAGYYGVVYIGRNTEVDPAGGKLIGYGFRGSPSSNNRVIHEPTLDLTHVIWRDPKYGTLQTGLQYSYVIRHPWSVATGTPTDAHTHMIYANLRFVLPGTPPTVNK